MPHQQSRVQLAKYDPQEGYEAHPVSHKQAHTQPLLKGLTRLMSIFHKAAGHKPKANFGVRCLPTMV